MNAPHAKPQAAIEGPLRINLEGPPEIIARLLSSMADALNNPTAAAEPEPLFVSREEAARRAGVHRDRLSAAVRCGDLTNYGPPGGRLSFNLAQVMEWKARQG